MTRAISWGFPSSRSSLSRELCWKSLSDYLEPNRLYSCSTHRTSVEPHDPAHIIQSVEEGLYITELIGLGVNLVTGDYLRGAVGFWIDRGELTYPMEEITIAGNLKEMLLGIEMVGNDLTFRSSVVAPTIKIRRMTVAGH